MKKHIKHKRSFIPPRQEFDIASLLNKMQQQLVLLEQKIDALLSRPSERPAGEGRFSNPLQRFGHSYSQGGRAQENSFRERALYKAICADCNKECEVPFRPSQDRPVYCRECFSKRKNATAFKKKPDNTPGEGGQVPVRHFDRHRDSGHRKPGEKKKPSFHRRKERAK